MVEAADAIATYTARGRAAFDSDSAVRDAILYQIVVLGEAAKAVLAADPSLQASLPEVEWVADSADARSGSPPLLGDRSRCRVDHGDDRGP